jgi:hypothetical protein
MLKAIFNVGLGFDYDCQSIVCTEFRRDATTPMVGVVPAAGWDRVGDYV